MESSKRWCLEFLLPWCDNVDLKTMKAFRNTTKEQFLDYFFERFTLDLVGSEMKLAIEVLSLWQRLAMA